jgi:hypothetical protein
MSSEKAPTAEEKARVAPPPEEGGPAVTTRAAEAGRPALAPGALNPDLAYAEADQGFGDVGVDQEPDAAAKDTTKEDPTYTAAQGEKQQ